MNHVTNAGGGSPNRLLYEAFIGPVGPPPPPPPDTPPSQPVLTATAGNASVALSWTAPNPGSQPISTYRIYRWTASSPEALLVDTGTTTTTYVDATAVNGTTYWYQVSATSAVGEGPRSAPQSATPQAADATRRTDALRVSAVLLLPQWSAAHVDHSAGRNESDHGISALPFDGAGRRGALCDDRSDDVGP